jgi:hypothetical protein
MKSMTKHLQPVLNVKSHPIDIRDSRSILKAILFLGMDKTRGIDGRLVFDPFTTHLSLFIQK